MTGLHQVAAGDRKLGGVNAIVAAICLNRGHCCVAGAPVNPRRHLRAIVRRLGGEGMVEESGVRQIVVIVDEAQPIRVDRAIFGL